MRTLADALTATERQPSGNRNPRKYRGNIGFVIDVARHSTKLDRNQKARLLVAVEIMERRTKGHGRRNGVISIPGIIILRALLFRFHNAGSGLCCPSIETLQRVTGLCRQSVVSGLKRLEAARVLVVTRRLVRVRQSCGVVLARQGSNLYGFRDLPAQVPLEIGPKSWRLPGVHRVGTNHTPPVNPAVREALLQGFSSKEVRERRRRFGLD